MESAHAHGLFLPVADPFFSRGLNEEMVVEMLRYSWVTIVRSLEIDLIAKVIPTGGGVILKFRPSVLSP